MYKNLASRHIFNCSKSTQHDRTLSKVWNMLKSTIKVSVDVNIVTLEKILMLTWCFYCRIGASKCRLNLDSTLGWIQYPLREILNIHIYSQSKKKNLIDWIKIFAFLHFWIKIQDFCVSLYVKIMTFYDVIIVNWWHGLRLSWILTYDSFENYTPF